MSARPRIKIPLTQGDTLVEILSVLMLLCLWCFTIYSYLILQDTIPTHYGISGKPDDFGSKKTLFLLPIIGTIIFIGLTVLNRLPHIYNYPSKITEENAQKQYTIATRLIRLLKLFVLIIFFMIVYFTFRTATGKSDGLGKWFLPFTLILMLLPTTYYIFKSNKKTS